MLQESLCARRPSQRPSHGGRGDPIEKCGIPGFHRLKCDSITHTKQQFAWQGVTRDFSRKELVAVHECRRYFLDSESSNIHILDAKICHRTYKVYIKPKIFESGTLAGSYK